MDYPNVPPGASDETRDFIKRIEAIEELGKCREKIDKAIEAAVDACARSFFEAVRLAMFDVGDVSASEYQCYNSVSEYYCLTSSETSDGAVVEAAHAESQGRSLLLAVKHSLDRQLGQKQSPREVLSALMLILQACECVQLERRYGR